MKKNNIVIIFFLITLFSIFLLLYKSEKQNEIFIDEQNDIILALNYIDSKNFFEAKTILEKYEKNERYIYSIDFSLNYAVVLSKLDQPVDKQKEFLKLAYNSNPMLLKEPSFINFIQENIGAVVINE